MLNVKEKVAEMIEGGKKGMKGALIHRKGLAAAGVTLALVAGLGVLGATAGTVTLEVPAAVQNDAGKTPKKDAAKDEAKGSKAKIGQKKAAEKPGKDGKKDAASKVQEGASSEDKAAKGQETTAGEANNENTSNVAAQAAGTGGASQGQAAGTGGQSSSPKNDAPAQPVPAPQQHVHNWVTTTEVKQTPVTTYVTAEQSYYTLYRMYWYDSGTWEETRDHNRFSEWCASPMGGFYTAMYPYDRPEDNPLFLGYDGNGNATYTNDHVIISNLFEWVPCEPYEKTEIQESEVTETVCPECGAQQ